MKKLGCIYVIIVILAIIGEVMCIVKAIKCDWNPIGKAEIVYTIGICTGTGAIIGWFDIVDE